MLDAKEQSVRANNYSAWKSSPEEIYSIVQKGHKTKPEQANGDYYYYQSFSLEKCQLKTKIVEF